MCVCVRVCVCVCVCVCVLWNITQPKQEWNTAIYSNIDPKIIILSEISQTEKDEYHMISLICGISLKKDTNEIIDKTEIDPQT